MPEPDWEALQHEIGELVGRVNRLEKLAGLHTPAPAAIGGSAPLPDHPLAGMPNLLPVIGRALVGLAGAYLLRALTESAILAPAPGIALGIAYALFWLARAALRSPDEGWYAGIDSLTAVLILCPLLWEATTRFHLAAPPAAAAALLIFAVFGMAISWRKSLLVVSTFAALGSLATGAALLVETRDVLPFTFLFLATAAAIEASACLDHWLSERWPGAIAADLAVLLVTWLVTNEHGLPAGYAPIPAGWLLAAQAALLTIYLSSLIVRTLLRGYSITVFETIQCAAAFAISLSGGLRTAPVTAGVMLVCAAACYLACFALLERREAANRNFYIYSTFAILLALAGTRILLAGAPAAWVWYGLALAGIWTGAAFHRQTLEVHGAIFLVLALGASGVLREGLHLLLGATAGPGSRPAELSAGLAVAGIAYGLLLGCGGSYGKGLQLCPAAVAAGAFWVAAAATAGFLTAAVPPAYGPAVRTGVLAGSALALAWAASRWRRPELSILVYPAMLLAGYRFVTRDLHQDHKIALFLSLLLLGVVLTALPRFKRA